MKNKFLQIITVLSFLFSIFILLSLLSCGGSEPKAEQMRSKKIRETSFIIAILPEQNVFEQKKKYKPLTEFLSEKLDVNVKIKLLDSYGSIYDEIRNKTIDAAFFGSLNYVLTKAKTEIEPIARAVEKNGVSNYRGLIFTRKDKGITSDLMTWKNKKIALVHEVTTAGYIFPAWYLKKNGIQHFEQNFSKIVFYGSHDAAIMSVFKGDAEIGAAKDLIFEKLLSENPAMKDDLIILASSIKVPSNSLCVRSDLDDKFKQSLKKILLSLHTMQDGKHALEALNAVKFKETKDEEYDLLRKMTEEIGININTYSFREKR